MVEFTLLAVNKKKLKIVQVKMIINIKDDDFKWLITNILL